MPSSFLAWILLAGPAGAATLYVDDDAGGGGTGSIERPFASVQAAVDAARDGDDISVAEGTYAPFAVDSKEVRLLGSYDAAFATASADTPSVVEGTPAGPVVTLYETADSVLDGFVIRGGQRGILIDAYWNSTVNRPIVRNNVIEQNGAPDVIGGGVSADHCDFTFSGNTLRDNIGDRGAGLASSCNSIVVEGNVVEGNVGYGDHGGGLYMAGPEITVRDNLVRGNEIGVIAGYGWGAGALVFNVGSTGTFERNVFTGNHAQSVGSGAFVDDGAVATFTGDLFYANQCTDQGGAGLYVDGYDTTGSHVRLTNVTMAAHRCPGIVGNAIYAEAYSTVDIVDSVFWDNGGGDFTTVDGTSTISAAYTLSEDPMDGEGDLSADPLFADPENGDFHVRSTAGRFDPASGAWVQDGVDSPTIDAGDPGSAFDLEPGPNGLRVNLGHTGNTAEASMGGPGGDPPATTPDPTGSPTGTDPGSSTAGPDPVGHEGGEAGCGCAVGGRPAPWLALGLALLARRRRST